MPDYRRRFRPGGTYFFTVVTYGRAPILESPEARRILRLAIRMTKDQLPFTMDAIVVLPDHVHTIWTLPDGDENFPARWSVLKRTFTQHHLAMGGSESTATPSQQHSLRRGVWQRRYWEHLIRDEDDFARHVAYIHYNPVKHGIVECPHGWPASSFKRFVRDGFFDEDWLCVCNRQRPKVPALDSIARFVGE